MKKNIVVVDIDGTISKVVDRLKHIQKNPPDWDSFYEACFEDEPIPEMVELVQVFMDDYYNNYDIVFCTGRRESVRWETGKWLNKHGMRECEDLLMRPDGDHRHDTEVKPELLKNSGYTTENVAFIIEDRNSMVKKWRELGFICLQPAEGDF